MTQQSASAAAPAQPDPQPDAQPAQPDAQPAQPDPQPDAPAPDAQPPVEATWRLRRVARTPGGESCVILNLEGERLGDVSVQYLPNGGVEGLLALLGEADDHQLRRALAWLTDALSLDQAAGAGEMIHWTSHVGGRAGDFFRRSPGRRLSGGEVDLIAARARIESVLSTLFENVAADKDGDLVVDVGSVRVFVSLRTVDTVVTVRVFCITNVDVRVEPPLPAYLLGLNFGLVLGRFSLDSQRGAVWFDHALLGAELDDTTLARVLTAVAATADRYDDEIKARFGGRTFREEGSPPEVAESLKPSAPAGVVGLEGGYL